MLFFPDIFTIQINSLFLNNEFPVITELKYQLNADIPILADYFEYILYAAL